MMLAHLADLHVGYRAYERSKGGRNVRERDVARAFQAAVKELIRLQPSAVLVAGDVFHRPDPPAGALVTLARGLETLRSSLPGTPVLMVAGARDTPRSWGDPGALAALDTVPNVEAVTGTPRSVHLAGGSLHVLLVPHRAVFREPRLDPRPDPGARWNVLVAYGAVDESRDPGPEGRGPADPLLVNPEAWDYVALGHDHRRRVVAPRVVYPGSLERVGPEPWIEALEAKGFVTVDLNERGVRFHEIQGRAVVALAPIRWDPARPERMNERIREVSREVPGGLDGKIVRLRLEGLTPPAFDALDPELLASLRDRALHLSVEAKAVEDEEGEGGEPELPERVRRRLTEDGEDEDVMKTVGTLLAGDSEEEA